MNLKLRVSLVCAFFCLTGALAQAVVPVTVFPNPIQFGAVPLNSTSSPLTVFVNNTSVNAVTISNMTISGANSANFAFDGFNCVGTISGDQSCQMNMTFTPNAMGNFSATLVVTETELTSTINIPLQGSGGNPIPAVTSLSPSTVYVNAPSTTITINGSGFLSSTTVFVQNGGGPLPTTFVSATQITTQVPDTVLTSIGQLSLSVTNPAPGGGTGFATLNVVNPEPSIGNITPSSIVAGTASEPIIVNGQNFSSSATVKWNGTSIPTTFISPSQLQAQPTTSQLKSAGIVQVSVANPSPGILSAPVSLDVTFPITVTVLDLPANDIVWDPFAQRIYASIPSSAGSMGNSIAVINPAAGTVTGTFFAGSEPNKLALDSSSVFLYVGLDGNGSIQRLNLPSFSPDIDISLGNTSGSGPNLAGAIAVNPTNAHMIAVSLASSGCCFGGGPLEFFTDSTKLANSVTSPPIGQLAFASGTTLYGYVPGTLSQVNVSSTGGTLNQTWSDLVTGSTFQLSGGLIFGANGAEFNPATGLVQGTFDVGNFCCGSSTQLLPNTAINRAFALGQTPFFGSFGVTSYNMSQFTPIAVASLAELSPPFGSPVSTSKLIQFGTNGLAFILTSGCCGSITNQIVLAQSSTLFLTATKTANPVPSSQSSNPGAVPHGSANFRMTLQGSGFVPGSVVLWNGKKMSASYVNGNQMTVYVPAADVASVSTANIQVKNPTPGGGMSNPVTFSIQ